MFNPNYWQKQAFSSSKPEREVKISKLNIGEDKLWRHAYDLHERQKLILTRYSCKQDMADFFYSCAIIIQKGFSCPLYCCKILQLVHVQRL